MRTLQCLAVGALCLFGGLKFWPLFIVGLALVSAASLALAASVLKPAD
jgi:hypothetical protein